MSAVGFGGLGGSPFRSASVFSIAVGSGRTLGAGFDFLTFFGAGGPGSVAVRRGRKGCPSMRLMWPRTIKISSMALIAAHYRMFSK
jgi:hypothetical protein